MHFTRWVNFSYWDFSPKFLITDELKKKKKSNCQVEIEEQTFGNKKIQMNPEEKKNLKVIIWKKTVTLSVLSDYIWRF